MTRRRKNRDKGRAGAQKTGSQKRRSSTASSRTRSRDQSKSNDNSDPNPARSRSRGRECTGTTESEPLSEESHSQTSSNRLENKETQTETVKQITQQTQTEINGNTETTTESQPQTSSSRLENKETQTDTVSQRTQQTQTEIDGNTETTEMSQPTEFSSEDVEMKVETVLPSNKGHESDGEKEEVVERKKRKISESMEPKETKERLKRSDDCREQDGDKQKDKDTNEKHSEADSQKVCNLKKGTEEPKSYAAAAAGKTEQSNERNQTAADQDNRKRKPSPVRAPNEQPKFTFHIYAVLDKRFRFDRQHDTLMLHHANGFNELQITHFFGLRQDGYLIEATFSVWDSVVRGVSIEYAYAVKKKHDSIRETALRCLSIPKDETVKELHLYEGYISTDSRSVREKVTEWLFQNEQKELCKHWETSAHALLKRIFQKWGSFKKEDNKTLIEHLKCYKTDFHRAMIRLKFTKNPPPPLINVSELISNKLSWILKGESGGKMSESSTTVNSLEVALSVFQVCRGCDVDISLKDWGKLCQVVFESTAFLGENQTDRVDFIIIGLMNQCARKLISEVVLLVPVLHVLRKPGAKSDTGSALDEQRWAGLENIEYSSFRERIRGLSDKRRRVLQLIKDHVSMTKDKPDVLKSWLSMVAFEDVSEFAQLTGSLPELLMQSLMYRLKETEQNNNDNRTESDLKATEQVLKLLLSRVEEDRGRESKSLSSIFQCCRNVHMSACKIARLVPQYRVTVLTFQLLLKMAEIFHDELSKGGEEMKQHSSQLLSKLSGIQEYFSKWRDRLLFKPLLQATKFSYPKEIQLWSDLYGIECSIPGVSESWKGLLDRDLRKRVSQISDIDKIVMHFLETSAKTIENSHANLQSCFKDSCAAAIKNQCEAKKEGDLLHHLFTKTISWPIVSSIIVQSAARFGEDHEGRLLDPQSAVCFFLSQDKWSEWKLEEDASRLIAESQSFLGCLIKTLCQGSLPLRHLKAIFKYKAQFQKLYNQYKNNNKEANFSIDVSELLSQREDDLKAFEQQKEYMTNLINMLGKISDVVDVPEFSSLEAMVKTNLQAEALNKLVEVQTYFSKEDLDKNNTRRVLFYCDNQQVQKMAQNMHEVKTSNLLLYLWREKATEYFMPGPQLLSLDLTEVHDQIWTPCLSHFLNLGKRIALGEACFKEVDQALEWCGDKGEGDRLKKEITLMATMLSNNLLLDKDWPECRLSQIQEYRRLYHAAESAEAILKIKNKLGLQGDFTHIHSLTQVRDNSFKQKTLGSLSDDLIRARQQLADVTRQHTACLEAFLESDTLINWVKTQIPSLRDLKVFMELATISAGEIDVDIDRLASFETAVMGYGPLLYSLSEDAGFNEFIVCAKQVWDTLDKDEKLQDKLVDSTRWLDWLKGLRETHGSVEQSSLSLASAINTGGVYHVGWPEGFSGKIGLDNVFNVKVMKNKEEKTYNLNELLELQNKLMLMSSKGEHGREQVNKFTQVFEGVQRMGCILLQLQRSGNMLFQNWGAQISCNHQDQPCIQVRFSLLSKCVVYQGEVEEELQKLCRSLEAFHQDWCKHINKMRSQFYPLNHYTSKQVVYLCEWINSVSIKRKPVPQQMWHLLSHVKPDCTLNDIKEAFEKATETVSMVQSDMAKELGKNSDFDLPLSFSLLDVGMESLEDMWQQFMENMSRFLTHHVDVETLGRFLSNLSAMNELHIKRKIPPILQEGRPNLVQCPVEELISTTLSFYTESPEYPLPTTDEVLMCQEETTEEEVEIFLRRCLGVQGNSSSHNKIYTLVNPGSLTYDVSVALAEYFEAQERCAGSHYRLVMVCPVNQDRYVPSFFSNYKVQTSLTVSAERSREYIRHHFHIPPEFVKQTKVYPGELSVWMITSKRPAVGKSLYVKRIFEQFKRACPTATLITIRLIEPNVNMDGFVQTMSERLAPLREQDPVLLHIDVAAVCHGLEEFLFKLLILGCLSDSKGIIWRRNAIHLVVVEALHRGQMSQTQMKTTHGFLNTLPTIFCRPPKDIKEIMRKNRGYTSLDPLMDDGEFKSEDIQRPYQYLRRFNMSLDLDRFKYQAGSVEGDPVDCLCHLLSNYGLNDPSWAELKHFTWFLNLQLKDCENTLFCDPDFRGDSLSGFKDFIVKFMIHMARDFASPSVDISDQSPSFFSENEDEEEILCIRKRWENESHPYIFFNADHLTMSFLGFHVKKNGKILNAVDPRSGKVLMQDVMTQELFSDIEQQRINLSENFDDLSREVKIQRISFVVGAKKGWVKGNFDPDPTYELTTDNVMKMLAIHMRFRCEIPVIIMGETGCGKTRLVRFLCDLQREDRKVENMKLVKVHGGTTSETIYRKVREAEKLAENNRQKYQLDTVLFFDEANTTEAIFAIKEVLCDKTVQGYPLKKNSGLKIIAACNPYRRHTPKMVERLEKAGLGYRVKAEETEDRLGKVPMRQLVYRVHPLPPSMVPLVWDFGQLSNSTELCYIRQIVQKEIRDHGLPLACQSVITEVLSASQIYMRNQADECSFVSLRDVKRSMSVLAWFYNHRDIFFPGSQLISNVQLTLKCLVLAVSVCYYPSLENKTPYLATISKYFPNQFNSEESLQQEIASFQDFVLENIPTRKTIAKNVALKENVFLMVVCIELRIPLFLVGKPGSSKSLAKTVVADAMQRQASHCDLFKKLKEVHMVSFQCSPHSSPEGIIGTFRNCARFQKDKNFEEYVSVVVLDEIGLAEDSPQMPLKTLHPLLEDGCIDSDNPEPYMKVGFIGISNWALDPAKMNRGIFVSRWDPSEKDLVETAEGICSSSKTVLLKIKHLLPKLAKVFLNICKNDSEQFFGLRDYYSLIKMLYATVSASDQEPCDRELAEAVLRNFSGQRDGFDPIDYFQEIFQNFQNVERPSTLKMIEQNLDHHNDKECRYLLLLTTNNAALYIIQHHIFSKENHTCPEIVFGSGFPKDQEYAQVCRNVSRIKACMETGRTVILLNLLNLYESLYDALNQYYVYFSGQQYVDLGLGSHRVKCRVHRDFRLVVVEDQEKVYKKFPVPLKNRLEKHKVDRSTDLTPWQHRVLGKLKQWAQEFSKVQLAQSTEANFSLSDAFVGFHGDACASALLQALEKIQKWGHDKATQNDEFNVYENEISEPAEDGSDINVSKDIYMKKEEVEPHHMDEDIAESQEEIDKFAYGPQGDGTSMEVDYKLLDSEVNEETEALVDSSNAVQMDEDPVDVEARGGVESNNAIDEEEEAYETAKYFLLNCSTPDSVLRLRYSKFGNQEKDKLQRMYFHQQSHQSLRDLLNNHLNKTNEERSRFVEVTTFSNLLTGADLRNLAPALGLSTERLLLLSLHQFDTEASFCSKIRSFLREARLSLHILLIQVDMEETLCKNELIASAKYCTMNEILSLKSDECNIYTVFITKLSRIGEQYATSGNKYIGFQGGVWLSAHIDDLRDSDDMSLNLKAFCGIPLSKLISQTIKSDAKNSEEMDTSGPENEKGDSVHLHSLSLVTSCTQKAVSLLRDTGEKTSRSIERMNILFGLLGDDPGRTGARFQEVLLRRLTFELVRKEELIPDANNWAYKVAKNHEALQECGTLRHTLWRHLQDFLTPVLVQVLEVLDRDCNLYLLYGAGLSEGLAQFWLDIFEDQQLLDFNVSQNSSTPDQEINMQCHLFVGEVEQPCAAPFSWLIKTYCQSLWEESEFVRGSEQGSNARIQQFQSAVLGSKLGGYIQKLPEGEKVELGQRYLNDYVLLSFKVHSKEEHVVFRTALLGCVFALQTMMSVTLELSPSWVLAAAHIYAPRMDTLSHVLQLSPQLVHIIQQERSKRESPDMCEDILAVGICVEKTKLLPVTSLTECQTFLQTVEKLQPCLERVLSPDYSKLCSPACLKYLDTIKSVWQGMLLVAAFIEKVVIEMKTGDERIKALTLKHCSQLHGLMEGSPDLKSKDNLQQIIRILNDYHEESFSRELRYGVRCSVCLSDLSEPTVLPCEHVFCLSCVRRSIEREGAQFCPMCRKDLSNNYRPTISTTINSALKQHKEIRKCCNAFFLEVVSRFCLTEDQVPSEDLVELLFSLLISAQGDVYKTRELTPFLECVDQSPVVRSVLPKLLLQYSFKQVKKHIQRYLENLENKLLDQEDRTELYRLFVNCFQDSLFCSESNGDHRDLKENSNFLSRLARKQTPSRQNDPAEFLLSMAHLRMCLDSAARILARVISQRTSPFEEAELKLMEQVKAVCGYCDNDWYRVYLLRALNRQTGMDCLKALISSTDYEWIFPPEIIRLHRLIPAEVDRFLCCGQSYRILRDGVGEALHEGTTNLLRKVLGELGDSGPLKNALLTLAVFRQVTCRYLSPERETHPQEQEMTFLVKFIRENISGHTRELCTALLFNQIGGPDSNLSLSANVPARRRPLLELLVHACTVFYSGNRLIIPLFNIASQPQNMAEAFLPTMPDDHTTDAQHWLSKERLTAYFCSNGHACFVGECGRPMALSKCATCGVRIGGENHRPVPGFTEARGISDMTQPGHILGQAGNRSEAPNRKLTVAQSSVLRLCLHLAMLQGAIHHQQGITRMIHPTVSRVFEFLWQHLEKDMEVLGKALNLNMDDSAIIIHLIFNRFLQVMPVASVDLLSRRSREQWEIAVCKTYIQPVLQDLDRTLGSAQDLIENDHKLSNSPLVRVLRGDPKKILKLPSNCPTHYSAFWSPSPVLTVESISQKIDQSKAPLLTLFVKTVHCIRQLVHLPTLAALLSDLMKVLPPGSVAQTHTIASLLHSIPSGHQKKLLSEKVQIFMKVWNKLRVEISNNASLGLERTLCETDITNESSGQFLSLSRNGPGSCLYALIDLLSETHNSLVREARKLCHQEDSDYKVPLAALSESQLALCHPERELLPLVLANCHYTLESGQQTVSSCDHQAVERELNRRFFAGKPRIQMDTDKYLKRHHQNFIEVLNEVRAKIPQEPLKGSVLSSMKSTLRSFTDVCDAVYAVEIGLRFLGKTGGEPQVLLLSYLKDSLKMHRHISSNIAEALKENRLSQCIATWQLLTCWKSQQMMRKGQDPFQRLSKDFQDKLTAEERKQVKVFLGLTDIDIFSLELHEILQLKTNSTVDEGFAPHWDIRSTMEFHLDEKNITPLPGLDSLPEEITLAKAAEIWWLAVQFKH